MSKQKIRLLDVKHALLDDNFRKTLPKELTPDVGKFLHNPGCACNHPIYLKVIDKASKQLAEYFPTKEIKVSEQEEVTKNEWSVINCSIHELAGKLRKLPPGRMQLDIARYQDQVTVVINNLGL